MPSGAAQLASHSGGRCRHRGAVIGCRVPRTLRPERGCAASRRPPPWWPFRMSGHRPRRPSLCRILCPPCGQTSVQRVGRTSDVHSSSVHATGVMRMSGQTGVRCPRPLQPCCPHRAGSRNAPVPRDWPRWAHRVRRVAVVGERLGRRCPNRACREGWSCVGQCVAGTSGDGRPGPPLRTGKGGGAALTAWATKGAGAALGAGRVAGGAREGAGAHTSLRRCVPDRLPAWCATWGWTGRW
jgi:hypothetical protein